MIHHVDIPNEFRNQLGGFFIVSPHTPQASLEPQNMQAGDELLLGPLLTAQEAETLLPAITALYAATLPTESEVMAIGLARIEDGGYTGRFNAFLGLDPEGKELENEQYEAALDTLRGTLASGTPSLDWTNELPPEINKVFKAEVASAANLVDPSNHIQSLLKGFLDPEHRESTFALLELLIASGATLPRPLVRDLFRAGLVDRWARKADIS